MTGGSRVTRSLAWLGLAIAIASGCRERDAQRAARTELRGAGATQRADGSPDAGSVELVARHTSGVPLHPAPGAGEVSGRLPGGTRVRIEERSADGRWLRVEAADGRGGWITRRYAPSLGGTAAAVTGSEEDSAWSSPEACRALLAAGRRAPRTPNTARIGTWNLRWFPDGQPGRAAPSRGATNLPWLACTIAWLDVDVIAVQEIKNHARARERTAELIAALKEHTGGRWQLMLDDCPNEAGQHVGFLWNEQRVTASAWRTLASLNPHGQACKDQLRPGFGGYFRFPGGLDVFVVSTHLKSGGERRSFDLRRRSIAGLGILRQEALAAAGGDSDLIVAGDFNTMGCAECASAIGANDELGLLDEQLAPFDLRLVPSAMACSQYFDGRGALLDHFAAATQLAELGAQRRALVSGFCEDRRCDRIRGASESRAYRELSDHCPLVVELDDRDDDPPAPTAKRPAAGEHR